MEWQEVGDKRHYRAIGRRGTYDLRQSQGWWEIWFQPKFTRGYQYRGIAHRHLFRAKKIAEGMDAKE